MNDYLNRRTVSIIKMTETSSNTEARIENVKQSVAVVLVGSKFCLFTKYSEIDKAMMTAAFTAIPAHLICL